MNLNLQYINSKENPLKIILETMYKKVNIDWYMVSTNPNLTPALMELYSEHLHWRNVFECTPYLSIELIVRFGVLNKSYQHRFLKNHISANCYITSELVDFLIGLYIEDSVDMSWDLISMNLPLSIKIIEKYKARLSFKYLAENDTVTSEIMEKYMDLFPTSVLCLYQPLSTMLKYQCLFNKRCWENMCQNGSITSEMIEMYIDHIDWYSLGKNEHISIDIIEKYHNKLNFASISFNKHLTIEFIEKYKVKLYWKAICQNTGILNEAFIEKFRKHIEWSIISEYIKLSIPIIEKYKRKWDWKCMSRNIYLTPTIIKNYEKKWCWKLLLINPCLTADLIRTYISRFEKIDTWSMTNKYMHNENVYRINFCNDITPVLNKIIPKELTPEILKFL